MDDGQSQLPVDCQKLERSLAHDYFCRFHMSVILAAVVSSGLLASKGLMEVGVSLGYRYPLAVAISYVVFLLLIRVWIWYVRVRSAPRFRGPDLGSFSFGSGGGGGSFDVGSIGGRTGSGFSGFGGGSSGGGGASSDWEAGEAMAVSPPSGGASSWFSGFDLGDGGDNDGWLVVLLLIGLVACIFGGGIYLVVAAPHILPEAAAQLILAGGLTRVSKEHHHNWMSGVIWSTWIPFLVVMLMASALGWEAHRHCHAAVRLLDLLNCPS